MLHGDDETFMTLVIKTSWMFLAADTLDFNNPQ